MEKKYLCDNDCNTCEAIQNKQVALLLNDVVEMQKKDIPIPLWLEKYEYDEL